MNKLEITFLCIAIIGFSFMVFDRSYDLGMQRGVAYQKCLDELGYDCTKQAVDEIYLPIEKEIDEYVYPLKLESEVSTLGEKDIYTEADSACLNNKFNGALICYNNSLGVAEIIYLRDDLNEEDTNKIVGTLTNELFGLKAIYYSDGTVETVILGSS